MLGISSCLAGIACTYSGKDHYLKEIQELLDNKEAVLVCPELLGGMSTPRDPCEIVDNKVVSIKGKDMTEEYYKGAYKTLEIFQQHQITTALLKFRSPSCGKGFIYDGTFSHTLIEGNGITTQLLEEHGITVFNENEVEAFLKYIEKRKK